MSMADSHHAIKGNSLMVLAGQLESSIREAARKDFYRPQGRARKEWER